MCGLMMQHVQLLKMAVVLFEIYKNEKQTFKFDLSPKKKSSSRYADPALCNNKIFI